MFICYQFLIVLRCTVHENEGQFVMGHSIYLQLASEIGRNPDHITLEEFRQFFENA